MLCSSGCISFLAPLNAPAGQAGVGCVVCGEDEPVAPSAHPSKAAKCTQVYLEADPAQLLCFASSRAPPWTDEENPLGFLSRFALRAQPWQQDQGWQQGLCLGRWEAKGWDGGWKG